MKKIKNFEEFIQMVNTDSDLQNKLKTNPVEALKEISFSSPVYTSDKLVYRIVVSGLIGVLFLGVIYFIYQYQISLTIRREYADKVLLVFDKMTVNDSLTNSKLLNIKDAISSTTNINGTTPDGIIAVFTAIIDVLAGLFAPSPFSNKNN